MFKRRPHEIPALNTTSTADISFMLLIFFLVTTSMDRDQGLLRQLPPLDDGKQEQMADVSKQNVMKLELDATGRLLVNDSLFPISRLRKGIEAFVGQEALRTKHILQVKTSPETPYDAYFQMQNQIVAAYAHLRDLRARRIYHRGYAQCSETERDALRQYYPQRIAEEYPEEGGSK